MAADCQGTGGAMPSHTKTLINGLRSVTQRVAQQATFDARVSDVEAYIAKLSKESDALAMLAFESDFFLQSKDGIKVPAIRKTLTESSDYFVAMLQEHTKESHEGGVATENSADALRYVSQCVHTTRAAPDMDADTLLEVCELAEIWQLPEVLKKAAAAFGDRFDSATALKALLSAQKHIDNGSTYSVWKDILDDAAKAVAAGMPDVAKGMEFKQLTLETIAQMLSYLQDSTFELPEIEGKVDGLANKGKYGLWSEPVSWLNEGLTTPEVKRQQFCLRAYKKEDGRIAFHIYSRLKMFPTFARGVLKLTKPDGSCPWQRGVSDYLFVENSWGRAMTEDTLAKHTSDSQFRLSGSVTITKEQRQSEVFNLWLLASGKTTEPLQPPAQLQRLRECASGFDFIGADAETLVAKLEERGLPASGNPQTLRLRLRDALLPEVSLSQPLIQASKAFATLGVRYFELASEDGSLYHLDAATMSQLLAHKDLDVSSEYYVLGAIFRWASHAGRTDNVVNKVMPLVRFPLISMIDPPCNLNDLKERSSVVAELVAEAIKIQLGQEFSSVKKHALLPSMPPDTEQPRDKRRKSCKVDEIPQIDAASELLGFILPSRETSNC